MNETAVRQDVDRSTETPKMVHLGPPDSPVHVTYCGAVTAREMPDTAEIDCVVCIEMARAEGWLV